VCVARKGSGIGFPIAGAAANGLAIIITISWAIHAASFSPNTDNQIAENGKKEPPQTAEPLKKEPANEIDPAVAKKEADKMDAAEKRIAALLAQAEELEKKSEHDRRKAAEDIAKVEASMKALLELQKTVGESQKEVEAKRQELATLQKKIDADKKKGADEVLALKLEMEAELQKLDLAKKKNDLEANNKLANNKPPIRVQPVPNFPPETDKDKAKQSLMLDPGRYALLKAARELEMEFEQEMGYGPSPPKFPAADILESWQKTPGVHFGWMGYSGSFDGGIRQGKKGEIPAFFMVLPGKGTIAKLKSPEQPFGLRLFGRGITDEILGEACNLKNLRGLDIFSTDVTDDGLKHLANLKELKSLKLQSNGKLTSAGMKELAGLTQLLTLDLASTAVNDDTLKELKKLKQLRVLSLFSTKVTDPGLKELEELKKLRLLDLRVNFITDAAIRDLQVALPNLIVHKGR
jgi:hypothetical protein